MKKVLMIISVVIIVAIIVTGAYLNRNETCEEKFFAFNTLISVKVTGNDAKNAVDALGKEATRLDKLLNAHSSQSEVSMINTAAADGYLDISEEVYLLIKRCIQYSQNTEGAFDITVKPLVDLWDIGGKNHIPDESELNKALKAVSYENIDLSQKNKVHFTHPDTRIDLGAVAKGYAADRMKEILSGFDIDYALIDLGGNIYAYGEREYRVGIQHPDKERGEHFKVISAKNASVVTSGAYERGFERDGVYYHHILSPFDGKCADSGIKSVTVVGEVSEMCDAYSTAVYVKGKSLADKLQENNPGVSFVIMEDDGTQYETK